MQLRAQTAPSLTVLLGVPVEYYDPPVVIRHVAVPPRAPPIAPTPATPALWLAMEDISSWSACILLVLVPLAVCGYFLCLYLQMAPVQRCARWLRRRLLTAETAPSPLERGPSLQPLRSPPKPAHPPQYSKSVSDAWQPFASPEARQQLEDYHAYMRWWRAQQAALVNPGAWWPPPQQVPRTHEGVLPIHRWAASHATVDDGANDDVEMISPGKLSGLADMVSPSSAEIKLRERPRQATSPLRQTPPPPTPPPPQRSMRIYSHLRTSYPHPEVIVDSPSRSSEKRVARITPLPPARAEEELLHDIFAELDREPKEPTEKKSQSHQPSAIIRAALEVRPKEQHGRNGRRPERRIDLELRPRQAAGELRGAAVRVETDAGHGYGYARRRPHLSHRTRGTKERPPPMRRQTPHRGEVSSFGNASLPIVEETPQTRQIL